MVCRVVRAQGNPAASGSAACVSGAGPAVMRGGFRPQAPRQRVCRAGTCWGAVSRERRACVAAPSAAAGASRSYPHRRGVQPVPAFFLPWRSLVSAATSLSPAAGVSHGRGGRPPAARKWPVHAQPWRKSAPAHAESSAGMARPSFLRRILTARPARSRGARHFGERPVRQALHRPQGDRRRPGGRGQRPCGRPVRQG